MNRSMKCFYCESPAMKLCDGKVGEKVCSRGLCLSHVAKSFSNIACIRAKGNHRSVVDSGDYCPDCVEEMKR